MRVKFRGIWVALLAALMAAYLATPSTAASAAAPAAGCPGSQSASCPYDRLQLFGAAGPGALHEPSGVAWGPGRTVLVADPTEAQVQWPGVQVFDSAGHFLRELRVPDSYNSYGPQPAVVAVAPSGEVFALGGGLWRWDANGTFLGRTQLTGGQPPNASVYPIAIAAAGDGTLWVLYRDTGRIEHLDSNGALLGAVTAPEPGNGIAVGPDGTLFMSALSHIDALSPSGALLRRYQVGAVAITVDAAGVIYAAGPGEGISRIATDGTITSFGSQGSAPGQYQQVQAIDVTPAPGTSAGGPATLAVADTANHRVQLVAGDGTVQAIIGTDPAALSEPLAAWDAPDGGVFVADSRNDRIAHFDAAGAFAGRGDGGSDLFPEAGVRNPLTGDSDVLAADGVRRFNTSGTVLGQWPLPDGGNSYSYRRSLTAGADGSIYIANSGDPQHGSVSVYSADGHPLRVITGGPDIESEIYRPTALAVAADGTVFVVNGMEPYHASRISIFGPSGAYVKSIDLSCVGPPTSIAVDDVGRLFVSVTTYVLIMDQTGAVLGGFGGSGTAPGQFMDTPALTIDSADLLTIADRKNDRVTRVHIIAAALHQLPGCGGVKATATQLAALGDTIVVPLACATQSTNPCRGSLTLYADTARRARQARRVVLSSSSFSIRRAGAIRMVVRSRARGLLRGSRRLRALLVIDAAGQPTVRQPVVLVVRRRR